MTFEEFVMSLVRAMTVALNQQSLRIKTMQQIIMDQDKLIEAYRIKEEQRSYTRANNGKPNGYVVPDTKQPEFPEFTYRTNQCDTTLFHHSV